MEKEAAQRRFLRRKSGTMTRPMSAAGPQMPRPFLVVEPPGELLEEDRGDSEEDTEGRWIGAVVMDEGADDELDAVVPLAVEVIVVGSQDGR